MRIYIEHCYFIRILRNHPSISCIYLTLSSISAKLLAKSSWLYLIYSTFFSSILVKLI